MRKFLFVTAVLETFAGLVLLMKPSFFAILCFREFIDQSSGLLVARVAGIAIISLGVACWFARDDGHSPAASSVAIGMSIYNIGVAGIFAYAGMVLRMHGMALWPATALHFVMFVWCVLTVLDQRRPV